VIPLLFLCSGAVKSYRIAQFGLAQRYRPDTTFARCDSPVRSLFVLALLFLDHAMLWRHAAFGHDVWISRGSYKNAAGE
jgi:hypothetical protein